MNPENNSNEELVDEFEVNEQTPSVDDFIKELEEKEKSLHISSDLVIEFDEFDIEDQDVEELFLQNNLIENADSKNLPEEEEESEGDQNKLKLQEYLELKKQVSDLKAERDELKETLSRRQMDFENYRNRTERERGETFKSILSNLAAEILPVLDNLNRAVDSVKNSERKKNEEQFLEGIVLVNQQLNEVFAGMGVQPILAVGEPFDPNFHEAVASEQSEDVSPGTVMEEMLRGYRIDNKVIRPSMVKVSSAK